VAVTAAAEIGEAAEGTGEAVTAGAAETGKHPDARISREPRRPMTTASARAF